jgi:hypothetical protein
MAIGVVTNESSLSLSVEVTEGTYVAPSASTDYIELLSSGTEMNKNREELSRDVLSGTVEQEESRVGVAEVSGSLPVEYRASVTAGEAPQSADKQLRSLLGGKRQAVSDITTTGNTSTVLEFGAAHGFLKGDCVLVKEAGAFEVRPISEVGATTITFPFALENGAPSDGVEVEAVTTYYHDTANSVTLSAEHNIGGEIAQLVSGLRVSSMSLENVSVGQIPSMNFSVEGIQLDRVDQAPSFSPDFSADALPPVALEACLWVGGAKQAYTELSLNIENTISFINSACDPDGKIGSRITEQSVSLTCNPYMDDTDLTEWDAFNLNADSSAFWYAFNPSSTAGEFSEVVAFYLPQTKITELPVGDQDGISTNNLSMKSFRKDGNDTIFMSYV